MQHISKVRERGFGSKFEDYLPMPSVLSSSSIRMLTIDVKESTDTQNRPHPMLEPSLWLNGWDGLTE